MKRLRHVAWLVPVVLAVLLWWLPPRGDDAYYHTVSAVEQVRAWQEGAILPRYHRAWNGGTGSFIPTVYSPIPLAIQGGLAWLTGDGQRAVGLSLGLAVLAAAAVLFWASRNRWSWAVMVTPYFLAVAVTRATTTEAWALAGAAAVLVLGLPPGIRHRRQGLGLAGSVALVSASQLGMLLQLAWLLGVAWGVAAVLHAGRRWQPEASLLSAAGRTLAWAGAGLTSAAVFWVPAIMDGANLALREGLSGDLGWHSNFLPGGSPMKEMLTLTGIALLTVAVVVGLRGRRPERLIFVATVVAGLLMTVAVSAPLWHLPGMAYLQFPWRFLGPVTIVALLAVDSLAGRWQWLAVGLLVLPSAVVPLRIESQNIRFPVTAPPAELARLAEAVWGLPPILPSARGFYAPGFDRLASLQELRSQPVTVTETTRTVLTGEWTIVADSATRVMLPVQWWPEWSVAVDGVEVPFSNHSGLVAVECGDGVSIVRATLQASRSRALGLLLSIVGLLMVGAIARTAVRSEARP